MLPNRHLKFNMYLAGTLPSCQACPLSSVSLKISPPCTPSQESHWTLILRCSNTIKSYRFYVLNITLPCCTNLIQATTVSLTGHLSVLHCWHSLRILHRAKQEIFKCSNPSTPLVLCLKLIHVLVNMPTKFIMNSGLVHFLKITDSFLLGQLLTLQSSVSLSMFVPQPRTSSNSPSILPSYKHRWSSCSAIFFSWDFLRHIIWMPCCCHMFIEKIFFFSWSSYSLFQHWK